MKVANFNGCKVYNLSTGKTMPEWLSQTKKRALAKDEEYQKRLELIQDFEMTTAAQCITMTKDTNHIIVAGTYTPVVKCFTTTDLAMKFQRGLTAEVVSMQSLSDDFGKIAFLQNDRTINIHAPYGTHYSLRVPKFGRHMIYNWDNCDLYISSSSNEIYRLNLELGQFREPYLLSSLNNSSTNQEIGGNKLHLNPVHQLLACGCDNGFTEFWDPRQKKHVSSIEIDDEHSSNNYNTSFKTSITAVKFDSDGLTLGLGTNNGNVYLYDIRSKKPLYIKEHQYGLPIVDISYHHTSKTIISTDKKVVKIWERESNTLGKNVTNIETPSDINDILFVNDRRGETGLIMIAGEQSRIMTYFIPQLGPAPRWCSFLENLTEELEENTSKNIYEDYKFITRNELDELGATSLLGTNMLKAYMHGFFIDIKLYNKLRAVSKPFEYEEYRKQKIKEKIDSKRSSRISSNLMKAPLPKVNQGLAEKLIQKEMKHHRNKGEEDIDEEGGKGKKESQVIDAKKLIDPRFAAVFEKKEFQQDENDADYKLRFPVRSKFASEKQRLRKEAGEDEGDLYEEIEEPEEQEEEEGSDSEEDDYDDIDEEDLDDNPDGFNFGDDDDNEDQEERYEGSDNDDDDDGRESNKLRKRKRKEYGHKNDNEEEMGAIARASMKSKLKKMKNDSQKKMKMFTLNDSINTDDILFSNKKQLNALKKEERILANLPIQQRLQQQQQERQQSRESEGRGGKKYGGKKRSWKGGDSDRDKPQIKVYKSKDEGVIREISFFPSK